MKQIWDKGVVLLASGLGVGWIPFAPGTWGSACGIPLAWAVQQLTMPFQVVTIALLIFAGIPICHRAAQLLATDDPGSVVYDEIIAMPIVFLAVPLNWGNAIAGFLLFRLFDISKPPPVSQLEKLHGGFGVMADDVMAALYAAIALVLTCLILGWETFLN